MLNPILSKIDDVPEAFREHYTERDGRFFLEVTKMEGLELSDTSSLMTALQSERSAAKTAKSALKKFGELNPEEARSAIKRMEEWGDLDPNQKATELFAQKETQLKTLFEAEKVGLTGKNDKLTRALEGALIDSVATTECANNSGNVMLLLPHIRSQMRMVEQDNGQFVSEVIDAHGNARLRDASGALMTCADLVLEMKASEAFQMAFKASSAKGGDTPLGGGEFKPLALGTLSSLQGISGEDIAALAKGDVTLQG